MKLASLPAIEMLLEAGADPNLVDSTGLTSTHMAVQGRDSDCLEALLQWGKFPCDLNYRNFEGLVVCVLAMDMCVCVCVCVCLFVFVLGLESMVCAGHGCVCVCVRVRVGYVCWPWMCVCLC